MRRPGFAERHPYWFVAIMEVMVILVYLVAGTVAYLMELPTLGLYGLANLGLTIMAAVLLTAMGWWKKVGFVSSDRRRDLIYYLVPFIPMMLNLIPGVQIPSLRSMVQILAVTLMVGFAEEVVFRGLMLQPLRAHGSWKAVVISALLFGLTHAMNALTGKSLVDSGAQIMYAIAIGFAYAALALKRGLLWPLVLAHFLIDFVGFVQRPGVTFPPLVELAIVVSTAIVFTVYGIFVMRQTSRELTLPA